MPVTSASDLVAAARAEVEPIDTAEAARLHQEGGVVFVDVREPGEWQQGRIPGALHVPRGLLEWAADPTSPSHRSELAQGLPVAVYCAAGGRSALAAQTLKKMGVAQVMTVDGGFTAWAKEGRPVER